MPLDRGKAGRGTLVAPCGFVRPMGAGHYCPVRCGPFPFTERSAGGRDERFRQDIGAGNVVDRRMAGLQYPPGGGGSRNHLASEFDPDLFRYPFQPGGTGIVPNVLCSLRHKVWMALAVQGELKHRLSRGQSSTPPKRIRNARYFMVTTRFKVVQGTRPPRGLRPE